MPIDDHHGDTTAALDEPTIQEVDDGIFAYLQPDGSWGLNNTGDFDNLTEDWYWSGTEYAGDTSLAWTFNMHKGTQNYSKKYFYDCGLAVRSGEVSAAPVPEPGTMLLFSTGLAGLAVLRRKRKGSCV